MLFCLLIFSKFSPISIPQCSLRDLGIVINQMVRVDFRNYIKRTSNLSSYSDFGWTLVVL